MADIELVIKIDDKVYEYIKSIPSHTMLEEAVIDGTPLVEVLDKIREEIRLASTIEIDGDSYVRLKNVYKIFDGYIQVQARK